MQYEIQDLETLLVVQKIDLEVMRAKKARAELPQRIQVVKIRKKRDEISPKLDQVLDLQQATQAEITKIEDEDRGLKEKQERAQELIDSSGSDYRKVESHSKEMAGVAKRRVTLEENMLELTAKMDKINEVRKQLEDAIATCQAEEARLKASYQSEDEELVEKTRALLAKRAEVTAAINPDLLNRYDKIASKAGGVGIGKLEGDTCGICRSTITGGHLIDLRNQAPLGVCPSCKRLLIIGEDAEQ